LQCALSRSNIEYRLGYNGAVGSTLDAVGNRGSAVSTLAEGPSGNWGFNVDDELAGESYDKNHNVIASGGNAFAYDSQNPLIAKNGGSVSMSYGVMTPSETAWSTRRTE